MAAAAIFAVEKLFEKVDVNVSKHSGKGRENLWQIELFSPFPGMLLPLSRFSNSFWVVPCFYAYTVGRAISKTRPIVANSSPARRARGRSNSASTIPLARSKPSRT